MALHSVRLGFPARDVWAQLDRIAEAPDGRFRDARSDAVELNAQVFSSLAPVRRIIEVRLMLDNCVPPHLLRGYGHRRNRHLPARSTSPDPRYFPTEDSGASQQDNGRAEIPSENHCGGIEGMEH